MSHRFFGKYRAVVTAIDDPQRLARIQASVPNVTGESPTGWAMPCLPHGVPVQLPPIGAGVWIEFEHGDPDYPIWTGRWWSDPAEVPELVLPHVENPSASDSPGGFYVI